MKNAFPFARFSVSRFSVLVASASLMLLSQSCDFCRRLAGRPDSEEIEQMRIEMLKAEQLKRKAAIEAAREDSLRVARAEAKLKDEQDSLKAAADLQRKGVKILPVSTYGISKDVRLSKRYYIVTGSYKMLPNAERQAGYCRGAGYVTELVKLSNGYYLVAVSPSDKLAEAASERERVSKENFCPEDSWILVNDSMPVFENDGGPVSVNN